MTSLSPDDDFFRCGGNSLTAIELLIKIQRAFHLTIQPDTIYRYPTIRQQALMIAQKTGTGEQYHPLIVPIRARWHTAPPVLFSSAWWLDRKNTRTFPRFLIRTGLFSGFGQGDWNLQKNQS